ncbi:MAG: adenine deaminase [Lachnospirales bacterium]
MNSYLENKTKILTDAAMGRKKANIVIKNTSIINTNTREIVENMDIGIVEDRICLVGNCHNLIGDDTKIIDGTGLFASPGFMDGHIHVESSMVSITEYGKEVMRRGTTAIFHDPHEIGNVLGTYGIDLMLKEGENIPLKTFCTMPSCVPAVLDFEEPAHKIESSTVCEYLKQDNIIGLGEMMDMYGVINNNEHIHEELKGTLAENKTITGHFTIPTKDNELNAYIATGINCCHETVTKEDALKKMRLGMYVQMREGSAWQDVKELVPLLVESNIDSRFATLVSDDTHPNTLMENGHMDHILRLCVELGLNPVEAIQMCTINTANCFNIARDYGSIAPGKVADIVLLRDLKDFVADYVIINGEVVTKGGKIVIDIKKPVFNSKELNTMNISKTFAAEDFIIESEVENGEVIANVINIIEVKAPNYHIKVNMKSENYIVSQDLGRDILKVSCIDRHNNIDKKAMGFVKGFNIKEGAVASTVAHDTHNINVIGTNDEDMAFAVNELIKVGGGVVVVKNCEVIGLVELKLAGLMSVEDIETTSQKVSTVEKGFEILGCDIISPFMTMALLSLAVIPELRLTNKGLVDTVKFEFINLFD